jgi:rhodanese-related sulfurtransferase
MENVSALVAQYWWLGLIVVAVIVLLSKKTSKAFGGETEEIDAQRAAELIEQEQALLIDLAEKTTFEKGHIPCAVNMPGISFINGTAELADTTKPVILVPMKGLIPMPVVQYMDSVGVPKTYIFKGGLAAWQEAGLPL